MNAQDAILKYWKNKTLRQIATLTKIPYKELQKAASVLKIQPITNADLVLSVILQYRKKNTVEEIAKLAKSTVLTVQKVAKDNGIKVLTNLEKANRPINLELNDSEKYKGKTLYEVEQLMKKEQKKYKRTKGVYTQTGSDTLDKITGIKTTKRIK